MIGVAVLGCGRIGTVHARIIKAHPRAELVACYDVVSDSAEATAQVVGTEAASSIEEILADARVQAVLIASPTDTHVGLIARAAKAGKAVLCEKPVDLDIGRVDACWREIAPFDPLVMIGFNRRFDPSFKAVRDRIQAGEIGRVEQVVITSRDPAPPPARYAATSGGLFRDMTIHDFDMARYLAGDIVEVQAMGATLIDPAIGEQGDIDSAMVVLRAASGALVHINNSRRCAYGYDQRIEAFGEAGMLQAHNRHPTTVESWGAGRTHAQDPVLNFFVERYQDAYAAEIGHFVDCVEQRRAPLPGFADGREALRLADAALESLATGRTVRVAPGAAYAALVPFRGAH
jgi:myo-inositol 2-dehydrogenase/D-chiro-inositol 1-dehydrogenase